MRELRGVDGADAKSSRYNLKASSILRVVTISSANLSPRSVTVVKPLVDNSRASSDSPERCANANARARAPTRRTNHARWARRAGRGVKGEA